eukprot:gene13249-biopygen9568
MSRIINLSLISKLRLSELPVHQVPEGVDEGSTVVLVVDVVRVLPQVAGQNRLQVGLGQGVGGIMGLQHLQLVRRRVLHKPHPPGAEVADGRSSELLLELLEGAKGFLDSLQDRTAGLAALVRGERLPEEVVVEDLRGRVEDRAAGGLDHLQKTLALQVGVALGSSVELRSVALVVLLVVHGNLVLGQTLEARAP